MKEIIEIIFSKDDIETDEDDIEKLSFEKTIFSKSIFLLER